MFICGKLLTFSGKILFFGMQNMTWILEDVILNNACPELVSGIQNLFD